jgi:hypothetical protein
VGVDDDVDVLRPDSDPRQPTQEIALPVVQLRRAGPLASQPVPCRTPGGAGGRAGAAPEAGQDRWATADGYGPSRGDYCRAPDSPGRQVPRAVP